MERTSPFALLILLPLAGAAQTWTQLGPDILGTVNDEFGSMVSMPDPYTVAVGSPYAQEGVMHAGHVRVFTWQSQSNTWIQKGTDIVGDAENDQSGQTVSMPDANTVAIGAPLNDAVVDAGGQVRVFEWNGSDWVQKGDDLLGDVVGGFWGLSVSMPDAQTLAIGQGEYGLSVGRTFIFEWNGLAWVQKGEPIYGGPFEGLGLTVEMPDPNTVAMSALGYPDWTEPTGAVYVYAWDGDSWEQKGAPITGDETWEHAGLSISMPDANTVAVGSPEHSGGGLAAGRVRVFTWEEDVWTQRGTDILGEAGDYLGSSTSMPDENTLAAAAAEYSGSAGRVHVYTWTGIDWSLWGSSLLGTAAQDAFGRSVSMGDANTLAAGAPGCDLNGNNAGVVRVYRDSHSIGINEPITGFGVEVAPNPTAGAVTFDLGAVRSTVRIIVHNATGQEVMSTRRTNVRRFDLNLTGPAGLYSVALNSEGGQRTVVKVMKD